MGHLSEKDYQRAASSNRPWLEWRLDQITSGGPFKPKLFYGYSPASTMIAYLCTHRGILHTREIPTKEKQ